MGIKLWLVASILAGSFTTIAAAQEIDWKKVDDTFGRKPAVSGDVHRYGFPRTDLTVTLDGVTIKPGFGTRRLGGVQANARRGHDHGRPRATRDRNQSGHAQDD